MPFRRIPGYHPVSDMPDSVFDEAMQQERNALSWERTSFSLMIVGALMIRHAAVNDFILFTIAGVGGVLVGTAVLVWAGFHYHDLHASLREGSSPIHPTAARLLGLASIVGTGLAAIMVVAIAAGA